ncbi:MAG: 50S ribosomal protein L32 [Candidatus Pacebacteria bacterium]|nr:50S ribosomal protein L32 [Candidatus Paceibacterota bacterium]
MRHTSSHTGKRRSHHFVKKVGLVACQKCGEMKLPHLVCQNCGAYGEREVVDVLKKLTKREKKNKEKELKGQEEQTKDKPLDATKMSKK